MTFVKQFLRSGALFSTSPGNVFLGWGECAWSGSPSSNKPSSFYFPDFFLKNQSPWCSFEEGKEFSISELIEQLEDGNENSAASVTPFQWKPYLKESFRSSYNSIERKIQDGTLMKGVPYIFETAHSGMNPDRLRNSLVSMLKTLLHQPLYAYGFWGPTQGLLGATPEILFRSDSSNLHKIETMACAGTQRSEVQDALFLQNPKEQHEHKLVIQGIKDSIAALGGALQVHETKLLKLPLLTHLLTPLSAHFPQSLHFEDLVKALHPTPALGTLPREAGVEWLAELQKKLPRYRYGAPAAIRQAENVVCVVAIRNVQWYDAWIGIGAGCGVVSDSHFEREWEELQLKISSIKKVLNL
jgi:isochorismate synthase EntC